MQAPVYLILEKSPTLYDFKSVILFQLHSESYNTHASIENDSLIPLEIFFDAMKNLSFSLQDLNFDDLILPLSPQTVHIELDTLKNLVSLPSLSVQLSFWKELITPHQCCSIETLWRFLANSHVQFTAIGFLLENTFDIIAPMLGITAIELSYQITFRIVWQLLGIRLFTEDYGLSWASAVYNMIAVGGISYALLSHISTPLPTCGNALQTFAPVLCPAYSHMLRGLDITTVTGHISAPILTWLANGGIKRQLIRHPNKDDTVEERVNEVESAINMIQEMNPR